MSLIVYFVLLQLCPTFIATITNKMTHAPKNLIITAISAKNGASTIECWKLAAPFVVSSQAGVTGAAFAQLGSTGNTSYAVIPAKYDGGLHNGPQAQ